MRQDPVNCPVELGVVGRPHGVRGEVKIFLHNPASDILTRIKSVFIGDSEDFVPHEILSVQPGSGCLRLSLKGISDRAQAGELKGKRIFVSRDVLPDLADGEFYVADLIGLDAFDGDEFLGVVSSSRQQGDIEIITIVNGADELQVPLVEEYVNSIAPEAGRVLLRETHRLRIISNENGSR